MNKPDESTIPVLTEIIELAPEQERAAAGPLADLDLSVGAFGQPRAYVPAPATVPIRAPKPPAPEPEVFQAPLAPAQFSTEAFKNATAAAPAPEQHVIERVVEKIIEIPKIIDRVVEVEKIVEVEKLVEKIVEVEKRVEVEKFIDKIVEVEKLVVQTKLVEVGPTDDQLEDIERRVREGVVSSIGPRVEQLLQEHLNSRVESILHFTLASLQQELRDAIDASLRDAISDSVHEHISQQKLNLKQPNS